MHRRGVRASLLFLALCAPALAADNDRTPPPDAPAAVATLERLRYENDLFLARDDAFFSGGFGHERHSAPLADWVRLTDGEPRRLLPRWVGQNVPGLAAGGQRVLRFGSGFAHRIQTPDDLKITEVQAADVPYASTLGAFWSWAAYDDDALNAFQVYAGVLGPAAGGREVHDLLHTGLARGPKPRGWRAQLENEPLLNVNYAVKRKLARSASHLEGWKGDLSLGFEQAIGTLETSTKLQLEFRAGARPAGGFAQIPDPPGQGLGLEPVLSIDPLDDGRLRFYGSLAVRATGLWYSPLLDDGLWADSAHPGIEYRPFFVTAIAGLHFEYRRFAAHVTYFGPGIRAELDPESRSSPSWLTVTFDLWR